MRAPWLATALVVAACGGAPETHDNDAAAEPAPIPADAGGTGPDRPALVTDDGVSAAIPVAEPPAPPSPAAGDSLTGTLIAGGTTESPLTTLQTAAGASVFVRGGLESDLRALASAEVLLRGRLDASGERPVMHVTGYEVLSVNGQRPWVGRVLPEGRLATDADTLRLRGSVGAPEGALVWVTGARDGATLNVASFGVIRQPR